MGRAPKDRNRRHAPHIGATMTVISIVVGCAGQPQVPVSPTNHRTPVVQGLSAEGSPSGGTKLTAAVGDAPPAHSDEQDEGADTQRETPPAKIVSFTRYPNDVALSPITAHVARELRRIREQSSNRQEQVFMKVGSSETVDRRYLRCFGGGERSPFVVELASASHLEETLEFFRRGDARGRNPFVRSSESAKVGRSTAWAYQGSPSPIRREIGTINPAWAIISFGTNDLNLGTTPRSALWPYHRHLNKLLDQVVMAGVVPIIIGPGYRMDSKVASRWDHVFEAVTRGIAEERQIPYVNLLHATADIPGYGLIRDGIHGNVYADRRRGRQPCIFTEDALQFGYNVRNLVTLAALDHARRSVSEGPEDLEVPPLPAVVGEGSVESPFVVDRLPFTHAADTSRATSDRFDRYPSCGGELDMSGPELLYRLELDTPSALRFLVFSSNGVDVDLHLLGPEPTAEACTHRDGRALEGTLSPGTYHLVVDTFAGRTGTPRPGRYLLVIVGCDADDPDCSETIG